MEVLTMPDEYISREAAVKALFAPGMCYAPIQLQIVKDLPAADVAPVVHGRWNVVEGRRLDNAICSNCGRHFQAYYEAYCFCPNCGAKMDGAAE